MSCFAPGHLEKGSSSPDCWPAVRPIQTEAALWKHFPSPSCHLALQGAFPRDFLVVIWSDLVAGLKPAHNVLIVCKY